MSTKKTQIQRANAQLTRSSGRLTVVKSPRRRSTDPAQLYHDDQTKAPQNGPRRPVPEQTKPTTPKTLDGVVPEIASATPVPASVYSPLSFHPIAEIFAVLDDDRLQLLANDIAQHGLQDDIVLYERKILDGRCRYLACERVGVAPKFRDYVGDDPLGLVISRNVHRRHLTKTQSAFAAARAATLPVGANQNTPGLPIGRAAEIFQVSERNIARAKAILRRGTAELVQAVESGNVAISQAEQLCGLADEKQIVTVKDIVERKRNPQKKTTSTGAVNENVAVGPVDGARQSECSPSADGSDLDIPGFLDRHGSKPAPEADQIVSLFRAAWQPSEARTIWLSATSEVRARIVTEILQYPE